MCVYVYLRVYNITEVMISQLRSYGINKYSDKGESALIPI